jgi:hypothetical protein
MFRFPCRAHKARRNGCGYGLFSMDGTEKNAGFGPPTAEVLFLFIGGPHQVYHLAPAAAELTRLLPGHQVTCLHTGDAAGAALQTVRKVLAAPALRIEEVRTPGWGRLLARFRARSSATKTPLLLSLVPRLRRAAAVVTPERTSSKLRYLGLRHSLMVHFRHGAGDRAPKSESRQSRFDLVVVPGEKDLRRAVEKGYLPAEKLRAVGYLKLEFCLRVAGNALPIFDNNRPVVLYNPHFDPSISSWPVARQVVERFAAQSRYNLVLAPHLRAAEDLGAGERAQWQALEQAGKILIDLDSHRLIDMSYAMAADIYLGDMSSQLYEFLARPRPVAFLNAHGVDWRNDPRFRGWKLGEVPDSLDTLMETLDRAVASHAAVLPRQKEAVRDAFGEVNGAGLRGAQVIAEAIAARAGRLQP